MTSRTRRRFVQELTMGGAAALLTDRLPPLQAQPSAPSPWRSRIGLELYTVRDLLMTDFEGTLAKVAAIGYTEIEPTGYNNMAPNAFRAMLDRYELTMPSTHGAARGEGAELDKQLEGFQVMGIKYTESRPEGREVQRRRLRAAPGPPGRLRRSRRAGITTPAQAGCEMRSRKPRRSVRIRCPGRSNPRNAAPHSSTPTARSLRSSV